MIDFAAKTSVGRADHEAMDHLELRLRNRLHSYVHDFRLESRDRGLVLLGRAHTYYAKQVAQHAVMQATEFPILANEIEVF